MTQILLTNAKSNKMRDCLLVHVFAITFAKLVTSLYNEVGYNTWYIGRAPPSKFEYDKINGYYSPDQDKTICENDIQCGGFTFKGTRKSSERKHIYFFHYINYEDEKNLRYPHWTIYVPSRKYIVIIGKYLPDHFWSINMDNVR